jgi:hypothetical protein
MNAVLMRKAKTAMRLRRIVEMMYRCRCFDRGDPPEAVMKTMMPLKSMMGIMAPIATQAESLVLILVKKRACFEHGGRLFGSIAVFLANNVLGRAGIAGENGPTGRAGNVGIAVNGTIRGNVVLTLRGNMAIV